MMTIRSKLLPCPLVVPAHRRLLMPSPKPLEGKVALITGASRGIGLAIARKLGEMGATLSICARDPQKLESTKNELLTMAPQVFAAPVDVTRPEQISTFIQYTQKNLGPIAILVNNAGV